MQQVKAELRGHETLELDLQLKNFNGFSQACLSCQNNWGHHRLLITYVCIFFCFALPFACVIGTIKPILSGILFWS